MADHSWAAPTVTLTTYLSTTLNSLADDTLDLGAEINNETNLAQYMDIEIHLASINLSAESNPSVVIYLIESIDGGTTYDTAVDASSSDAAHPATDKVLTICGFRLGTAGEVKNAIKSRLSIPPGRFKLAVLNKTGQAFAASDNTLKYRTYKTKTV